jgi:hypothetical protein
MKPLSKLGVLTLPIYFHDRNNMTKRGHTAQEVRLKHMLRCCLSTQKYRTGSNAQVMYRYLPKYHVHKMHN